MKLIRWCIEDCGYGIGVRGFNDKNGDPIRSTRIVTISADGDMMYAVTDNEHSYDLVFEDADKWFLDRTFESLDKMGIGHMLNKMITSAVQTKEQKLAMKFDGKPNKAVELYIIGGSIIYAFYKNGNAVESILPEVCEGLFVKYGVLNYSGKQLIKWHTDSNEISVIEVEDAKEVSVTNIGSIPVIVNKVYIDPGITYAFKDEE